MAPISLMATSHRARDVNRYEDWSTARKCSGITEDLALNIDVSTINNKIDFLRSMGLEISNEACDTNCTADTNDNEIENIINNNSENFCRNFQSNLKRPCKPSSRIRKCELTGDELCLTTKTKCHMNKRTSSHHDDMVDSKMIAHQPMRECSVMIIGEKCRVCGKSFKCIKDVQLHTKRKHRRRKPRTKFVLLRIGDEVISRLPIRIKHLKRVYCEYDDDHRAIRNSSDDTRENEASWNEDSSKKDCANDERLIAPLIDLDDIRDIVADTESNVTKITSSDDSLSHPGDRSSSSSSSSIESSNNRYGDEDDDDIREVLRITRSPRFGLTINHETPNRTERELLLSDAICEFDRMDNDPMSLIEFVEEDDEETRIGHRNRVIEDYGWLSDDNLQNHRLDLVENNCSYHIENDFDIDFSLAAGGVNSLASGELDPKYFDDDNTCLHSMEYRKENGDIVPDFIDYSQCLNDNRGTRGNDKMNVGNVYELENSFYEARISEWNNKLVNLQSNVNRDIRQRAKKNVDPSVLIKEEIMLDDLS